MWTILAKHARVCVLSSVCDCVCVFVWLYLSTRPIVASSLQWDGCRAERRVWTSAAFFRRVIPAEGARGCDQTYRCKSRVKAIKLLGKRTQDSAPVQKSFGRSRAYSRTLFSCEAKLVIFRLWDAPTLLIHVLSAIPKSMYQRSCVFFKSNDLVTKYSLKPFPISNPVLFHFL